MSNNTDCGFFTKNKFSLYEKEANIILIGVKDTDLFLVKPQSLLISPFTNCYKAKMFTYERFFNFFILSGFLEYSSFYGSFVLKRYHLESFVEKVKENNLSVCILTRFYSKPCDFYCRKHDDNYFLLVETRRSENLIVLPFLDDNHMVDLCHLYKKTRCVENSGSYYELKKQNVIAFCFIINYIYDRRVKIIDLKHYSLERTIKLKEQFSSYYKNKFINSLSNFNYVRSQIKADFYKESRCPNIWLVDSLNKNILRVEINHFFCFHTTMIETTLLRILNTVGLEYEKDVGFFIETIMLIPFQRVLFEHGLCAKRKCSNKVDLRDCNDRIKYSINLNFSKKEACYETENQVYLDMLINKSFCAKNPYITLSNSYGYIKSEDLTSFVFFSRFVDKVGVSISMTQNDVLKLDREIDPCFANFENKIASKPFYELPKENLEHKIFYHWNSNEANYRRANEIEDSQLVIEKYVILDKIDEGGSSEKDKNKKLDLSFFRRLKHQQHHKRKRLLKVREKIFGKNELKTKNVEAIVRDEKYWLEKEKADDLFKENLMNSDIHKIMNSTPSFMYDENSESMCSCTSDFYDNKLENFLNVGDEYNYDYKEVSTRKIKKNKKHLEKSRLHDDPDVSIIVENFVEESCEIIRFLDNDCDLTLKDNFSKEKRSFRESSPID